MTTTHTLRQRLRYRFDNLLARGTIALVLWLGLATLALIAAAALVLMALGVTYGDVGSVGEDSVSFIEAMWVSLVRTLDPGVIGADVAPAFRIVGLMVTLGGIFIVSTLIGLLATGISTKLDELRKGRSLVLESGHTLILGWSPKIITIISELMIANENQPRSSIVVLAPEDKVVMEDELRARVKFNKHTRVVCRTGNPADPVDLEIANPLEAKSVVILAGAEEGADAEVVKAVLALLTIDEDFKRLNVVAELMEEGNAAALRRTTRERISTVVSNDVIARITAQVCRQSGLSAVYQELLDFDGDEIYFAAEPRLTGTTFGNALLAYNDSSLIGIHFADGRIELNPAMSTVLQDGDEVIAISEDDDTVVFSGDIRDHELGPPARVAEPELVERILMIGWSFLGPLILRQLDGYLAPGSHVHVAYDPDIVGKESPHSDDRFEHLTVASSQGDVTDHRVLEELLVGGNFDHVIVMCYRTIPPARSDARALMTLVQLRQVLREKGLEGKVSIVTELLEPADVALARVANPDDFIISEQLVSLLLAQLAENPKLDPLFQDLFDSDRAEMVLKPASAYVPVGAEVPFSAAVRSAAARGEVAIGYRTAKTNGSPVSNVVVNPEKTRVLTFGESDQLIVLTSD
ncbi:MAG TPA: potassium transporter TrkA [Actinomycetota bacterium]|nr:potassium transporter TrkA [Actinomycetota bacterium]